MNRDLFRRYVWLVDTIRHAERIPYEEIASLWLKSVLNDEKSPLALRTFHNHRHAIDSLFGIRILCDRSDRNRYYISNFDNPSTKLKIWMMQKLGYSDLDASMEELSDRFLLDSTPEDKFGLNVIIEGINLNKAVRLIYSIPTQDGKTDLLVAPYCVRYWNSRWFLVGKDMESWKILSFALDRVVEITLTDTDFKLPSNFSASDCYRHSFGAEIFPEEAAPESVRLSICGLTRDKVRTLPLHESQKEVLTTAAHSVFEYRIIPGEDFFGALFALGPDAQVVAPDSLRHQTAERLRSMAGLYDA